jgi:stress-induced morphogen
MQSTIELLRKLDSLLEAFPRHDLAVQDRDAVAQMIQRDCWTHFQIEVAQARQKIRCELEALND